MKKGGTIAMKERKGLIRWINEHKKELIIAGISIGTLVLIILSIKNRDAIKTVWTSLRDVVKQPTTNVAETVTTVTVDNIPQVPLKGVAEAIASNSETLSFEVRRHIRNLPDGWHASPEKIAEALKNSIILMDGQTWVDSYTKGGVAA